MSALLGRMPSAPWVTSRRWPPRWASCRSGSPRPARGAITSVQAVYVPADDSDRPGPGHRVRPPRRVHLPGAVDLRKGHLSGRRSAGLAAAAFSIRSTSASEHYARRPPRAADPAALPRTAGHHRHPRRRRAERRRQAGRAPRPPHRAVPVAAVLRGRGVHRQAGQVTPLADTIRSFEEICDGKWDHLPEEAFMYVGAIEEAEEQAKKMAKEGE